MSKEKENQCKRKRKNKGRDCTRYGSAEDAEEISKKKKSNIINRFLTSIFKRSKKNKDNLVLTAEKNSLRGPQIRPCDKENEYLLDIPVELAQRFSAIVIKTTKSGVTAMITSETSCKDDLSKEEELASFNIDVQHSNNRHFSSHSRANVKFSNCMKNISRTEKESTSQLYCVNNIDRIVESAAFLEPLLPSESNGNKNSIATLYEKHTTYKTMNFKTNEDRRTSKTLSEPSWKEMDKRNTEKEVKQRVDDFLHHFIFLDKYSSTFEPVSECSTDEKTTITNSVHLSSEYRISSREVSSDLLINIKPFKEYITSRNKGYLAEKQNNAVVIPTVLSSSSRSSDESDKSNDKTAKEPTLKEYKTKEKAGKRKKKKITTTEYMYRCPVIRSKPQVIEKKAKETNKIDKIAPIVSKRSIASNRTTASSKNNIISNRETRRTEVLPAESKLFKGIHLNQNWIIRSKDTLNILEVRIDDSPLEEAFIEQLSFYEHESLFQKNLPYFKSVIQKQNPNRTTQTKDGQERMHPQRFRRVEFTSNCPPGMVPAPRALTDGRKQSASFTTAVPPARPALLEYKKEVVKEEKPVVRVEETKKTRWSPLPLPARHVQSSTFSNDGTSISNNSLDVGHIIQLALGFQTKEFKSNRINESNKRAVDWKYVDLQQSVVKSKVECSEDTGYLSSVSNKKVMDVTEIVEVSVDVQPDNMKTGRVECQWESTACKDFMVAKKLMDVDESAKKLEYHCKRSDTNHIMSQKKMIGVDETALDQEFLRSGRLEFQRKDSETQRLKSKKKLRTVFNLQPNEVLVMKKMNTQPKMPERLRREIKSSRRKNVSTDDSSTDTEAFRSFNKSKSLSVSQAAQRRLTPKESENRRYKGSKHDESQSLKALPPGEDEVVIKSLDLEKDSADECSLQPAVDLRFSSYDKTPSPRSGSQRSSSRDENRSDSTMSSPVSLEADSQETSTYTGTSYDSRSRSIPSEVDWTPPDIPADDSSKLDKLIRKPKQLESKKELTNIAITKIDNYEVKNDALKSGLRTQSLPYKDQKKETDMKSKKSKARSVDVQVDEDLDRQRTVSNIKVKSVDVAIGSSRPEMKPEDDASNDSSGLGKPHSSVSWCLLEAENIIESQSFLEEFPGKSSSNNGESINICMSDLFMEKMDNLKNELLKTMKIPKVLVQHVEVQTVKSGIEVNEQNNLLTDKSTDTMGLPDQFRAKGKRKENGKDSDKEVEKENNNYYFFQERLAQTESSGSSEGNRTAEVNMGERLYAENNNVTVPTNESAFSNLTITRSRKVFPYINENYTETSFNTSDTLTRIVQHTPQASNSNLNQESLVCLSRYTGKSVSSEKCNFKEEERDLIGKQSVKFDGISNFSSEENMMDEYRKKPVVICLANFDGSSASSAKSEESDSDDFESRSNYDGSLNKSEIGFGVSRLFPYMSRSQSVYKWETSSQFCSHRINSAASYIVKMCYENRFEFEKKTTKNRRKPKPRSFRDSLLTRNIAKERVSSANASPPPTRSVSTSSFSARKVASQKTQESVENERKLKSALTEKLKVKTDRPLSPENMTGQKRKSLREETPAGKAVMKLVCTKSSKDIEKTGQKKEVKGIVKPKARSPVNNAVTKSTSRNSKDSSPSSRPSSRGSSRLGQLDVTPVKEKSMQNAKMSASSAGSAKKIADNPKNERNHVATIGERLFSTTPPEARIMAPQRFKATTLPSSTKATLKSTHSILDSSRETLPVAQVRPEEPNLLSLKKTNKGFFENTSFEHVGTDKSENFGTTLDLKESNYFGDDDFDDEDVYDPEDFYEFDGKCGCSSNTIQSSDQKDSFPTSLADLSTEASEVSRSLFFCRTPSNLCYYQVTRAQNQRPVDSTAFFDEKPEPFVVSKRFYEHLDADPWDDDSSPFGLGELIENNVVAPTRKALGPNLDEPIVDVLNMGNEFINNVIAMSTHLKKAAEIFNDFLSIEPKSKI